MVLHAGKQTGIERVLRSRWTPLALFVLIALLANAVFNMYARYREAGARAMQAREEIALLEARKNELSDDLTRLNSVRGTEEELRRRFDVAGDGESVIVIVEPRGGGMNEKEGEQKNVWERFLDLFK